MDYSTLPRLLARPAVCSNLFVAPDTARRGHLALQTPAGLLPIVAVVAPARPSWPAVYRLDFTAPLSRRPRRLAEYVPALLVGAACCCFSASLVLAAIYFWLL